jgi:lauroyl/myristoyl acyltransferase
MNKMLERIDFHVVRTLERVLRPDGLHRCVRLGAATRSTVRQAFRPRPPHPLPACFPAVQRGSPCEYRTRTALNASLEHLPDRLGRSEWLERCRISGLDGLKSAVKNRRPVVLAFCHVGPFTLLRFWLRAAGIPAITLIRGKSEDRSSLRRMQDRFSPFPDIPTAIYQENLRDAIGELVTGRPLLMAFDGRAGKQMRVPVCQGWDFQMATGPLRMATNHGALLFPCAIVDEGGWRFHLEIGRPAPEDWLARESSWGDAGAHLFRELWPLFGSHPDQCPEYFLEHFMPASGREVAGP